MKKLIIIIAIVNCQLSIVNSIAQTLSPKVSPTSGGYYNAGGGNSLSWTMGETNITTLSAGSTKLSQGEQQPEIDLLTGTLGGGCAGSAAIIPFIADGYVDASNVFTAQLSNATGSFASPVNIGTLTSTASGSISATIPSNIGGGTGYRIRVISSAPVYIGKDNGTNLSFIPSLSAPVVAGPNAVCGLSTAIYTATSAGATSYTWTVPSGMTITSGQGTSTLHVNCAAGTISGNVSATASNGCSTSATTNYMVTKKPFAAGVITGPTFVCGMANAAYSIASVFGATSYTWLIPSGTAITSGAGTTSIVINIPNNFVSGTISVSAVNACGSVPGTSLIVYAKQEPGAITGATVVCGTPSQNYSIAPVTGATSYNWFVPFGMTITAGQGTVSITASVPTGHLAAGVVKVTAINTCGTSAYNSLSIGACATPIGMNNTVVDVTTDNYSEIYPNPANNEFIIDVTSDIDKNVVVEVYDITGQLLARESHYIANGIVNTMKTNIETFKNGMYFVRLSDENGNMLNTQRVVKQ